MSTRKICTLSIFVILLIALTTGSSALAGAPFEWLVLEDKYSYDNTWECPNFDVRSVGVGHMYAKIKIDEQWNILRNNAQTGYSGKIINLETGKFLFQRALWTWNMAFENNISTKSVLAGTQDQVIEPGAGVVWQYKGVDKFVGIYINLLTGEVIWTDPYHSAGFRSDADWYEAVCDALQ